MRNEQNCSDPDFWKVGKIYKVLKEYEYSVEGVHLLCEHNRRLPDELRRRVDQRASTEREKTNLKYSIEYVLSPPGWCNIPRSSVIELPEEEQDAAMAMWELQNE